MPFGSLEGISVKTITPCLPSKRFTMGGHPLTKQQRLQLHRKENSTDGTELTLYAYNYKLSVTHTQTTGDGKLISKRWQADFLSLLH